MPDVNYDVVLTVEDVEQADEILAVLKKASYVTGEIDFSFEAKIIPATLGVSEYKTESIG